MYAHVRVAGICSLPAPSPRCRRGKARFPHSCTCIKLQQAMNEGLPLLLSPAAQHKDAQQRRQIQIALHSIARQPATNLHKVRVPATQAYSFLNQPAITMHWAAPHRAVLYQAGSASGQASCNSCSSIDPTSNVHVCMFLRQ